VQAAHAQFGAFRPVERLTAEGRANAFVEWGGAVSLDGLQMELPAGWSITGVWAVPAGGTTATPLRSGMAASGGGRRFLAFSSETLRGRHLLVLGLSVGDPTSFAELTVTPLRRGRNGQMGMLPSYEAAWGTAVADAPRTRGRAFARPSGAEPLAFDRRALPGLHGDDAYTVEAWVKTTGLGEVVLSTWDGREGQTYPLEWVVDGRGRLVVYRGEPGRHLGMRTAAPVADGLWHHVAVTQDPARGWARLFLDGEAADSLRVNDSGLSNNALPLALGGRRARGRDARVGRAYSGQIDELRLWNRMRTPAEVRYAMRRPLEESVAGLVRVGFDSAVPGGLLAEAAGRVYAPSDLSFWFPVEALSAETEGGVVRLTWETKDRQSDRFVVERSTDGRTFRAVGEVRPSERVAEAADGTMRYAYTDAAPDDATLHYRIRQRGGGEPDRLSATLKLGRGADGAALARIVENAPNPFRTTTTIHFELGESAPVRMSVWDVSGARVATLVDGTLGAGAHEAVFDASDLPSGVYFVQLVTPSTRITHKLTLSR